MTPQQIVGMAAKLFAIWLVVIAFQAFAAGLAMKNQMGEAASSLPYLLPALPLLVGVLLWLFPMTIADKLVPRVRDTIQVVRRLRARSRPLHPSSSAFGSSSEPCHFWSRR